VWITSCNSPDYTLPNVTGKAGEVVLVIEDNDWNSDVGIKLREVFLEEYPELPQSEPCFDLVNIPVKAFTSIFKTHRNLVLLDISSKHDRASVKAKQNVYARPQTVVTIAAPDRAAAASLLAEKKVFLQDLIANAERQRIIENYKTYEVRSLREDLEKKHHLSLYFPKGYSPGPDSLQFVWITYETPITSQGVFVYYYEYTDTNIFNLDTLINIRDSVLKNFVPGPLPNTYMQTERENDRPVFTEYYLNGRYIAEIRGLWRVEGDYMGGPFISFSTVDEKRNRVVTVEGYVYAPKYEKRNYLRQVEAILHTLAFPDEENNKE
ncbi:MAG: DUF4837 family protein, partial [Bacteroidetes bacterium]|nr:DUF4837 family protein [Bacteroidota bacterium]